MGRFLDQERRRQAEIKKNSDYFTTGARGEGVFRGAPRQFCLPRDLSAENLFQGIRDNSLDYFAKHGIPWHQGIDGRPSNHLCDSQVCCVNFLQPFSARPDALLELLRPLFPTMTRMLPMEVEGQFVAYEWIGAENYLGEKVPRDGERTRGANFTSADAAVILETEQGARQIVLIEWKYTESYTGTSLKTAASGTSRAAIYEHLYDRDDCPINRSLVPDFGDLFYEPFYQFMRQQFLAHEMERAHELGADIVSLLHIAPAHNRDFQKVTSSGLRALGERVTDIWARLVTTPRRFKSITTEEMFGRFEAVRFPELADWWKYVNERYAWLKEGERN